MKGVREGATWARGRAFGTHASSVTQKLEPAPGVGGDTQQQEERRQGFVLVTERWENEHAAIGTGSF